MQFLSGVVILFCIAAAERGVMVLCGWTGGGEGEALQVNWCEFPVAHLGWESVGLSLQDRWATGHAPLGSFLIQSHAQEDLHLRVDLPHCLRQTPIELEKSPQFLDKVEGLPLYQNPNTVFSFLVVYY